MYLLISSGGTARRNGSVDWEKHGNGGKNQLPHEWQKGTYNAIIKILIRNRLIQS